MDFLRNLFGKKQPATSTERTVKLPRKIELLTAKLNDEDSFVRLDAVKEICKLKDRRAFEVLLKVYENRGERGGIREVARDGIWQINPKWMPNIPGVDIVEECVNKLIALYNKTPRGEGFIAHSSKARPVEKIGEKLDKAGGFELMVLAHGRFKQQRPQAARNLEYVWDGIGIWKG